MWPPSSPTSELLSPSSSPIHHLPRIHSSSPVHDHNHLSWHPQSPKDVVALPSFRSLFAAAFSSDDDHPLTSEYEASEYSEPEPEPVHDEDEDERDADDEDEDLDDGQPHSYLFGNHIRFNVSAERGKPFIPRHALLRLSARTTSPAPSPAPSIAQRNISEPAPSPKSPLAEASPEPQVPMSSSPVMTHSSPALSPISLSVSPIVGSVSPLSAPGPLSPFSLPPSSIAGDHDLDMLSDDEKIQTAPKLDNSLGLFPDHRQHQASSSRVLDAEPASIPMIEEVAPVLSAKLDQDHVSPYKNESPPNKDRALSPEGSHHDSEELVVERTARVVTAPKKDVKVKGSKDKGKAPEDKGKKRAAPPVPREDAPKTKKARVTEPAVQSSSSRTRPVEANRRKPAPAQAKAPSSRPDARAAPKGKSRKARAQTPPPEIDPELCGMLVECLAMSRASSMSTSALFKSVMESYPSVKSRGTEEECLVLMERVLESGTLAVGGSGVFGKVERKHMDDSDAEAQWFYQSDRDPDRDRAQLFVSLRPAKRNETKRAKQYFFKPLPKRWDVDDSS